jgi:hypothetical protein
MANSSMRYVRAGIVGTCGELEQQSDKWLWNDPRKPERARAKFPKLVLTTKTINCNTFSGDFVEKPKTLISDGCVQHPTFHFWNPKRGEYVPFHCGSWHCPSCAPIKVENVTGDLVRSAYENELSKHLTLTLDPKKVVGDPWVFNQKTWHKMCIYLDRLSKRRHRRLKWQRVIQIQPQTGFPHNHIMLSQFIPVKWIMKAWKALGGGSVYIRYVKIDSIGGFVRGYFTKQVLGFDFPRRKRRYSTSRNIKLARPKEEGWKLLRYVSRSWIDGSGVQKTGYYTEVDRTDFMVDMDKGPPILLAEVRVLV